MLRWCHSFRELRLSRTENTSDVTPTKQEAGNPKYVYVIVLSQAGERVLTMYCPKTGGAFPSGWYLPCFQYDEGKVYQSAFCIRDLKLLLGSGLQNFHFTVVAELYPQQDEYLEGYYNPEGVARVTLVNMESKSHFHSHELPSNAK